MRKRDNCLTVMKLRRDPSEKGMLHSHHVYRHCSQLLLGKEIIMLITHADIDIIIDSLVSSCCWEKGNQLQEKERDTPRHTCIEIDLVVKSSFICLTRGREDRSNFPGELTRGLKSKVVSLHCATPRGIGKKENR